MDFIGIGKTVTDSSACLLRQDAAGRPDVELLLTERLTRVKTSGAWPAAALRRLREKIDPQGALVADNRGLSSSARYEARLDAEFPFYAYLEKRGLQAFSSHFNPGIRSITHHLGHAYAAMLMSPFSKCAILVLDGAGSEWGDFPAQSPERAFGPDSPGPSHEECSVYLHDGGNLQCVLKRWQRFAPGRARPEHTFSHGLGTLYEKASELIFNCRASAGKVMGLAALGTPGALGDRLDYLEGLDWARKFAGPGKAAWEASGNLAYYADVAATVQRHFEDSLRGIAEEIRARFPGYENLIITGGCALNCTSNMKLAERALFREIYVPPFPGDESIALGAASYLARSVAGLPWEPWPQASQHGYFGSTDGAPTEAEVSRRFAGRTIIRPESINEYVAARLHRGEVLGWFQGRSETGPRALGNRSLLARADRPGIKDHLNDAVKGRESFRPYGCSTLHECASRYFEVPPGFNNPFMSFAARVRPEHRALLAEATHADGTSRMQTVRRAQNARFYDLLSAYGQISGLPCLLNTSLNVMGEPIVESVADARRFLDQTAVDGIAIGDWFIAKT